MGELSRREFLGVAGTAVATMAAGTTPRAFALPAQAAQGAKQAPATTLALVNGRIHTMDARGTVVAAASIRNGRFATVGDPPSVSGPDVRVMNLGGRTVVPGIIEAHIHGVGMSHRPGYHVAGLENSGSIREVQEMLAARRPAVPEGGWITALGGWHTNQWAEHRLPTRQELDKAVPDRPVLLLFGFIGPCVTNSLGKKLFDAADAAPPAHPAITPVAVADDGSIAAAVLGKGGPTMSALYHLRRRETFEDKKRNTIDAMAYSASVGVTTWLDQVLLPSPGPLHPHQGLANIDHYTLYDPWLAVHREGRTIIRLQMNFLHDQTDPELPELKERLRNQFQLFGDDMLRTGGIGEWAAPLGAGKVWFESQRLVAQARWRNNNSPNNLKTLVQVVEAYEAVNKEFGITGLRWSAHHVPEVNVELLTRLRALGCGVTMGANRWVTSSDPKVVAGPQFRTIVDHGLPAGIEGNGTHIAPLNPWLHMYYATTGVNSFGAPVNPGQHLTREEALRVYTRGNSWFLNMEDRIGSIEPGKLGDLVVLDRDYFAVPDVELKQIHSVLTVVDGKIVHNTGAVA
jgi:predicted amidohydrolase YtcJ